MILYDVYMYTFTCTIVVLPVLFWKYLFIVITLALLLKAVVLLRDTFTINEFGAVDRAVFITGCDTGLGNNFATYLDAKGFVVFAGCLNKTSDGAITLGDECSERLRIVEIDVTDNESVQRAYTYVKQQLPVKGLWGIVNNAGVYMVGDVECTPITMFQRGLNVNLFGAIRVTNAFLPSLRQTRGRIVNISSVHAGFALPHRSVYEVSKRCLETVSDSLRMELATFGVTVSIVQPGKFGSCTAVIQETEKFKKHIHKMWEDASDEVKQAYDKTTMMSWIPLPNFPTKHSDATSVSNGVAHALCSQRPRSLYIVPGYGTTISFIDEMAMLAQCYRILPTWITDIYAKKYL